MSNTAADYAPGSLRRHPDWPENPSVAMRSNYEDSDDSFCSAWLELHPSNGTQYRTHEYVKGWSDVEGMVLKPEPDEE